MLAASWHPGKQDWEGIMPIACILFHPPLGEQSAFPAVICWWDGDTDPSQQFLPLQGLTQVHICSPAPPGCLLTISHSQFSACGGDLARALWPRELLGLSSSDLSVRNQSYWCGSWLYGELQQGLPCSVAFVLPHMKSFSSKPIVCDWKEGSTPSSSCSSQHGKPSSRYRPSLPPSRRRPVYTTSTFWKQGLVRCFRPLLSTEQNISCIIPTEIHSIYSIYAEGSHSLCITSALVGHWRAENCFLNKAVSLLVWGSHQSIKLSKE